MNWLKSSRRRIDERIVVDDWIVVVVVDEIFADCIRSVLSPRADVEAGCEGINLSLGLSNGHPVAVVDGDVDKFSCSVGIADFQVPG